jgi:diguanylate cyclase (GGDEF)-like protein/PAS domain S-box-containing protein
MKEMDEKERPSARPRQAQPVGSGQRILIVDDNESMRRSLRLIFEKKGYETDTAGTGREAIDKVQGRFFNLALLDIRLPDMEGTELLAPLKETHPDMVVILVTGYASLKTAMQALNNGASGYITKPLNMDEVLAKAGDVLEKQRLVMENRRLFQEVQRELAERKRAEEALRESEEMYKTLAQTSPDAVTVTDLKGHITYVSQRTLELHGFESVEEILGRSAFEFFAPEDREKAITNLQKTMREGLVRNEEYTLLRKDKTRFIGELSAALISDAYGKPKAFIATTRNITERKRAEKRLAHMATHDPLTDLPNRMLFNDRLTLALAHAHRNQQKLTVMLLDLDHFKDVNDTLGHSMGDKLLQAVGKRLTSLLRKSDTVARMGGDEFMLILPEIARVEDTARVAQKVLEAFRRPFVFDGHELHITTSVGIAIYPDDGEDADTLVKNVDIAMYRAKAQGRDNYQRYF